tara:strand:+ start:566 stop:826 length:261 start_codon:yes stop_codon:yes gene_type:complete
MQWDDRKGKYVKPFTKKSRFKWVYPKPKFPYTFREIMDDWDNIDKDLLEDFYNKRNIYRLSIFVNTIIKLIPVSIITLTLKLGGII